MMPSEPRGEFTPPQSALDAAPVQPVREPVYRWYHKVAAVTFVAFCLVIGLTLLIFPWTDYWDGNYFVSLVPQWHAYWDNLYVRGAVSGLGVVNLYISLVEVFRLRRFSRS